MPHYTLPETLDRAAASNAATQLSDMITADTAVTIDGSAVKQIGQAGLQLLLSCFATAQNRGGTLVLANPSEPLCAAATLTGTNALLGC